MNSLYLLIPLSLLFLFAAAGIFYWAVNSGQYDDLDREGERILFEDEEPGDDNGEAGEGGGEGRKDDAREERRR